MGAQVQLINLRMSGTLTGGEEWSTGVWLGRFGSNVNLSEANLGDYVTDCFTAVQNWWITAASYAAPTVDLTALSGYAYEINSNVAAAVAHLGIEIAPGNSATPHPFQCAMVASLRSASPTRQGRGRMYLPLNGVPINAATGQYADSVPGTVCTITSGLLTALGQVDFAGAGTLDTVVYSRTQSLARPVVNVVVDSIPDVQRRRVASLAPVSSSTQSVTS